jgi:hypothetical protein
MSSFSPSQIAADQPIAILPGDRWRVKRRLQELAIPTHCPPDGSLRVEVSTPLALLQVRSTVRQFAAPRPELIQGLESCWRLPARREG